MKTNRVCTAEMPEQAYFCLSGLDPVDPTKVEAPPDASAVDLAEKLVDWN